MSLSFPNIPLYKFLEEAAMDFPLRPALSFFDKTINYLELLDACNGFARGLRDLGIKKGDRVAVMLPNIPQAVIAYYGILFAGAIVVQTNPLYTERELEFQLIDSGSVAIVCLDLVYPRVKNVKATSPLKWTIVAGIADYLPFPKNTLYSFSQWVKGKGLKKQELKKDGVIDFLTFIGRGEGDPPREEIDPQKDLALLQYTGGTTGRPKGVMLTHSNLIANVEQCRTWFSNAKRGEEIFLSVMPFFHVYGLTICLNFPISLAGCMVIVPRFQPKQLLKVIDREKTTIFPGAPTMYIALLQLPQIQRYDLSSIKFCISGSAPLPQEVQDRFESLSGCSMVEGYGLTECSPITHANPIEGKRKSGSIGLPMPNTEAKIVDLETGEDVPWGQVGELCVKGPQVMKGYWHLEEETHAVFREGWFLTGDIGKKDEEGYFYIVDRKKDVIIAGGFNVYPREVEEVLYQHPAIREAAVVGVPDPYRGETIKAYLVLKENEEINEKELEAFCRKQLAPYKIPRLYEYRDELPKTLVGKILRRVLIEEEKSKK